MLEIMDLQFTVPPVASSRKRLQTSINLHSDPVLVGCLRSFRVRNEAELVTLAESLTSTFPRYAMSNLTIPKHHALSGVVTLSLILRFWMVLSNRNKIAVRNTSAQLLLRIEG